MAYELFLTEAAHEDLDGALRYISQELSNPQAAANLLKQIEACYGQLRDFPHLYEYCQDLRLRNQGYRKVIIDNFVLIYYPVESEQRIYLLRFFYGGRDYEKLI